MSGSPATELPPLAATADASIVVGATSPVAPRAERRTAGNIAANFVGRMWTIALGIAIVPLYIRTLGVEGYGLIGFYTALQSILGLFDFGLGTSLNRQLALGAHVRGREAEMRDFTRTLEAVYWGVAAVLALACVVVAPIVATRWVNPRSLGADEVRTAVALMGVAAALQFPFTLYGGGLLGLQRQVVYNVASICMATLRSVGAVVVLKLVSPTVEAFFVWQVAVSAAQSLLGAVLLWRSLPAHEAAAHFRRRHLESVWRFAAATGGVAMLGVLLSQVDKVLLSRLLPLEDFGYYALAGVLGSSVYLFCQPVYTAYFPRFTALVERRDAEGMRAAYHEAAQLTAVMLVPAAVVAALFSYEAILLWTRDAAVARNAGPIARTLVASFALIGLSGLPAAVCVAHAWLRLGLKISAGQILLGTPLLYVATRLGGATGAAGAWVLISGVALAVNVYVVHGRILDGQIRRWLTIDVGLPLLASLGVAVPARLLLPAQLSVPQLVLYVLAVSTLAVVAAVAATPLPRATARQVLRRVVTRASARSPG